MRRGRAALALLPLAFALTSATCALAPACDACGGRFLAAQCKCTCPWSTVERAVIAHIGYAVVLILLLV
jgi:hypothetical protein